MSTHHGQHLFFCGALCLMASLSLPASAQNLVTNGGFEDGLKDWGKANASVFEVTAGQAAEGQHFVAIQSPSAKESVIRRVVGGLTAGQEYTLTVKTRKNTITDLRIVLRDTAKKSYVGLIQPLPSEDWKAAKHTFKAPGTEVGLEISARAPGRCDLDDVSIVAGKGDPAVESASAKKGVSAKPAAPGAATATEPFADQIAQFESFDKVHPPKPGAVLFVGSSTIKRWTTLPKYFPEVTVLNRGFGGARMHDVLYYVDRIVIPCKASHIVVYAGDNDLAAKSTPQDVLNDFKAFVAKVRAAQPGTPITFVSVKPSPHRERITAKVAEANRLVQEYIKGEPKLGYVDITGTLKRADGKVDASLFEKDGLHIKESGYKKFDGPIQSRVPAAK